MHCTVDAEIAFARSLRRSADNPLRRAHADPGPGDAGDYARRYRAFDRVSVDAPSIEVDTTADYPPDREFHQWPRHGLIGRPEYLLDMCQILWHASCHDYHHDRRTDKERRRCPPRCPERPPGSRPRSSCCGLVMGPDLGRSGRVSQRRDSSPQLRRTVANARPRLGCLFQESKQIPGPCYGSGLCGAGWT